MAGGQAAITWTTLNKALGGEVTTLSFTARMFLPVLGSWIVTAAVFWFLPMDNKRFEFTPAPVLGAWSRREKLALAFMIATVVLPYIRPLLPVPVSLVVIYGALLFLLMVVPLPLGDKTSVACPIFTGYDEYKVWRPTLPVTALREFPLQALSLWPITMAVSTLAGQSGAGAQVFGLLGNFWQQEPYLAVGLLVFVSLALAQVHSDTGAAGLLAPVLLTGLTSVGVNPVPWVMIMGFTVNLSFMIPAATGTVAVPLALGGRSHRLLLLYGFYVAVATGVFAWLFWTVVMASSSTFWNSLEVIK